MSDHSAHCGAAAYSEMASGPGVEPVTLGVLTRSPPPPEPACASYLDDTSAVSDRAGRGRLQGCRSGLLQGSRSGRTRRSGTRAPPVLSAPFDSVSKCCRTRRYLARQPAGAQWRWCGAKCSSCGSGGATAGSGGVVRGALSTGCLLSYSGIRLRLARAPLWRSSVKSTGGGSGDLAEKWKGLRNKWCVHPRS